MTATTAMRHRRVCPCAEHHPRSEFDGLRWVAPAGSVIVDGPHVFAPHPVANLWRCCYCGWFKWKRVR